MKSKVTQKNNLSFHGAKPPVAEIKAILDSSQKIIVVSHIDPDGDALGGQLAMASYLRSLGKEVYLGRDNHIPDKYQFLNEINDIPLFDSYKEGTRFDTAVILECPNVERVGRGSRLLNDGIRIINIDHHRDNDMFGEVNWININASSVGEMIYEYFEEVNYKIDAVVAEYLYTAILTDTGRFRYSSTGGRTMEIAGNLINAGASPQKICDLVYFNLQPATMKLTGKVLNTISFYHEEAVCILTLTKAMLDETGAKDSDSDGLVDFTLFNKGVVAGALIKEIDGGKVKVSMRSRNGINVAEIAGRFGGGGHLNASGCALDMTVEDARELVVKVFCEAIDEKSA